MSEKFDKVISEVLKKYGEGSIIQMDNAPRMNIEAISTGSLILDQAIGVGGIPRGRIVEIFGPESSGKTTLCQHIVAETQKMGLVAAYIDVEHALDREYMRKTGVDTEKLWLSQPDSAEQAGGILEYLVKSGEVGVVVVDSVAALVPMREVEADAGDVPMGLQARFMSHILRKLAPAVKSSNTSVVFTNQIRNKIGVVFGNPEVTSGGNALKFYASVRMDIRRRGILKEGTDFIGTEARVKIVKNKVGPPLREVLITIKGNGIDISSEILTLAINLNLVTSTGAHIYYNGDRIAHGKAQFAEYLESNPDFREMLLGQIKKSEFIQGDIPKEEEDN